MPFKPRLLRYDEEHAGPSGPIGGSLAAASVGETVVPTAPHDPTHDTVCGIEFDTIRDWNPDDSLLADAQLQCLARQLSDDAARLAEQYPATRYQAEGWTPPALDRSATHVSPATAVGSRRGWYVRAARSVAVAAGVMAMLALPRVADDRPASTRPTTNAVRAGDSDEAVDAFVTDRATHAVLHSADALERRVRYEDGDTARWGARPIDDSQFGPGGSGLGFDGLPDGGLPVGHDSLQDLLPTDSHGYCDVSM
ncbi:MAG: hypothetical protein WD875_15235 [Pirellulales bacterium]